jgi:hypothetical protein
MSALEISIQELSRLMDEAMSLARSYWAALEDRRAFPVTSGGQTTKLFSRPWPEAGLGRAVFSGKGTGLLPTVGPFAL